MHCQHYHTGDDHNTLDMILLVDYTNASGLIKNAILINKLQNRRESSHIVRWVAALILNLTLRVKLGESCSPWS